LGHDPTSVQRLFLATNVERVARRSCANNRLKRDDQRHRASSDVDVIALIFVRGEQVEIDKLRIVGGGCTLGFP
jgi:hypothetical protein